MLKYYHKYSLWELSPGLSCGLRGPLRLELSKYLSLPSRYSFSSSMNSASFKFYPKCFAKSPASGVASRRMDSFLSSRISSENFPSQLFILDSWESE